MRLLVVTQAVDQNDPVLGFFHGWVKEFSKHYEKVSVVCLFEGHHALPENVKVYSLGKEKGRISKLVYSICFLRYAWALRNEYDAVFVHMNQEYILLGGLMWKFLGKKVYFWRNHYAGNVLTSLAMFLSNKIFCTSKFSYSAKSRKTVLMPVGVDTSLFLSRGEERPRRSILFYARFSPSKRPDLLIEALGDLTKDGSPFSASFYGSPLPKDVLYFTRVQNRVKELGMDAHFHPGVPHEKGPRIFSSHDIFVDPSPSGMYNKTLFEAAACGALVLAASKDWKELAGEEYWFDGTSKDLARVLTKVLAWNEEKRAACRKEMRALTEKHSLRSLDEKLHAIMARA